MVVVYRIPSRPEFIKTLITLKPQTPERREIAQMGRSVQQDDTLG